MNAAKPDARQQKITIISPPMNCVTSAIFPMKEEAGVYSCLSRHHHTRKSPVTSRTKVTRDGNARRDGNALPEYAFLFTSGPYCCVNGKVFTCQDVGPEYVNPAVLSAGTLHNWPVPVSAEGRPPRWRPPRPRSSGHRQGPNAPDPAR